MPPAKMLFTSESVSMGHPDKVADQVSDAVLDAHIEQDPESRVACETLITTGMVVIAGEITSKAVVQISDVVRETIREIGYTDAAMGFDCDTCAVLTAIDRQSEDIAAGVDEREGKEQGAGDQGLMFGYACDETETLMPLPITLAHELMREHARLRFDGTIPFLRPDAKSQVTVEYREGQPARIDAVVLSTQHNPDVGIDEISRVVREKLIETVIPTEMLDAATRVHINPTGRFVEGGPKGDCGLTGRKIIVDTYGGHGSHGGGAFSGKDPSKVDRSGSYMARHVAKTIVRSGLARRCEVQISYAIGIAEPMSILVDTEGTGVIPDPEIVDLVRRVFPLKPKEIIEYLDLKRPIFKATARHGHFGRELEDFTWERTTKAGELRRAADEVRARNG